MAQPVDADDAVIVTFNCSHRDFCDKINIPYTNSKGTESKPSSSSIGCLKYATVIDMIASVGSFPVKYSDTTGFKSRPGLPKFNMGTLPSSTVIFNITYSLEEADRLSMGVFIESLYEWLPDTFLGDDTLLANNTWENIMRKALCQCYAENDSEAENDSDDDSPPRSKRIKFSKNNSDELAGMLKVTLSEIARKLAYNEHWRNGPGKEAMKALLDGMLRSKMYPDVQLDCSLVTHTTANSQRKYIRNANFKLRFDCGLVLSHTSLADVEVIEMTTNRAVFVIEVKTGLGGEGHVAMHMLLRYLQTYQKYNLHSPIYGIIASENMEKLLKLSLLGDTLTLQSMGIYSMSSKTDLLQLLVTLFYFIYGKEERKHSRTREH